jgi:hypothetical protein
MSAACGTENFISMVHHLVYNLQGDEPEPQSATVSGTRRREGAYMFVSFQPVENPDELRGLARDAARQRASGDRESAWGRARGL